MKRVVIANFYPVWPPQGGGQRRIYFLARELAREFEVEILTPERGGSYRSLEIAPGLKEFSVPVEMDFTRAESALNQRVKMAADLAYTLHWNECLLYQQLLAERMAIADVAVTAHPYSIYALLAARGSFEIPIVFDSQNVEVRQKRSVLGADTSDLQKIAEIEKTALTESALSIACSQGDAIGLQEEYGVDATRIRIIENGVDARNVPFTTDRHRQEIRARLGIGEQLVAVFGGSFHYPNFRAVDRVLECAKVLPDMAFLVLGTVCGYEKLQGPLPANVRCLGPVDESLKWLAYSIADVGLNPMEDGSGTNIKVFEYAAAKLAVLTTRFGARGVGLQPGREIIVTEGDGFINALSGLSSRARTETRAIGVAARKAVLATNDWAVIGRRYLECFKEVTGPSDTALRSRAIG